MINMINNFPKNLFGYSKRTPKVRDDSLCLKCEDGNEHSNYAMALMIGGRTGEHAPKN